jgi:hypothetical protein
MPVMPDDAGGGTTGGSVCQPPVSLAVDEVVAFGEIEDTEVDTTLRASASPSVPLLDVPLTEAAVVEVEDVVLDHADHNGDDEDDDAGDAALVDVSVAAIAASRDVDVIATVLEVQVVSLPYCRRWIWWCACGRSVACVIMAREANAAVYKTVFSCISRGRFILGSGLIDPYPSICSSFFKKQQEDEFVGSSLSKSALNAESIRRGTNSIRNDWEKRMAVSSTETG